MHIEDSRLDPRAANALSWVRPNRVAQEAIVLLGEWAAHYIDQSNITNVP